MFESPYGSPPLSGVKITGGFFADYQRIMKNDAMRFLNLFYSDEYAIFEEELARAASTGKPVLCSECVARTFGNELKACLLYTSCYPGRK